MRAKALLLGARPAQFEGPWIKIDEAEEWRADPRGDYGESVLVEVESSDGRCSQRLIMREGILIRGKRARCLILAGLNGKTKSVTVQLTQVR